MSDFTLSAKVRTDAGKGASRRLRREAQEVPAIVYGGNKEAQTISVLHKDLIHNLENEAFYTSVLNLDIEGTVESVVLKDLQRHPSKLQVLHADFLRIDQNKAITIKIPLHFINEDSCVGVKMQGGIIAHALTELEVSCLPKNLPEFIEVDMAEIEVGQTVHISDMTLPEGVTSVALSHGEDHDQAVANVITPRGGAQDAEDEEASEETGAEAETEGGEEATEE